MKAFKNLIESVHGGSWQLVRVSQNYKGDKYIFNAKTRFFQGFEKQNSFQITVSKKYADRLCLEYFGKKTSDLNSFIY